MKNVKMMLAVLLAALMLSGTAFAGCDNCPKDGDAAQWADFRVMMKERGIMTRQMMEVNRSVLLILQSLNHKPSSADSAEIKKLIATMDDLIAKDKAIGEKMKSKWEGKDWEKKGHHNKGDDHHKKW